MFPEKKVKERTELERVAAALSELEARRRVCPVAFFQPHQGQQRYSESIAPIVLVLTGNRWGKTEAAVAELDAAVLGYRPWLVRNFSLVRKDDGTLAFPDRSQIPSTAWVRRTDGLPLRSPARILFVTGLQYTRGIGEIVQEKFLSLWPKEVRFKAHMGQFGVWQKLQFPNGSEVMFGSAQQPNLSFEGFSSDVVFVDEPIPRRIFTAVRRGLIDRKGQIRWTMTPLADANVAWVASDLMRDERSDVELIRGTSYDNPYLDRDALRQFLEDPSLTEEERRARETGEIAALGRRIVTTFDDKCIIPSTDIPPEVPRVCVCDPHHAKPPALIWAAVYDDGEQLVIYREWPEVEFEKASAMRSSVHDLAGTIKSLEGKEDVRWRICDPRFGPAHARVLGVQYRSFVEEMADYGLFFLPDTDNDLDRGILRLKDSFRPSTTTKEPRVLVMRHCKNVIRALSYWSYEGEIDGRLKPSEMFKDFADCVRYLVMGSFPIVDFDGYSYLDDEFSFADDDRPFSIMGE